MTELQDFVRGISLMGWDGSNWVPVVVDASGNLYMIAMGEDATATLRPLKVDASGQLIMVPRGQSGNYLDVDASGFLSTIIKGNYAGSLITVACDSDGRLSAFIIDSVDAWGNMLSIGNAELAARLGSPVTYDRRGQVIWMDNFGQGFGPYSLAKVANGLLPVLDATRFMFGGYTAKLQVTANAGDLSTLGIGLGETYEKGLGIEVTFQLNTAQGILELMAMNTYSGNVYLPWIRYNADNDTLYYYNSAAVWVSLGTGYNPPLGAGCWNRIKMVWDMSTRKYIRVLFNSHEYDLSAQSLRLFGAATFDVIATAVRLQSDGTASAIHYLDTYILTNMEE